MEELFRLDHEVAVVTGAVGKLGPVWVSALLSAGARVAAIDLAEAKPSEAFCELENAFNTDRLRRLNADACDRQSLEAAQREIQTHWGAPTVLVNNAGIDQPPDAVKSLELPDIPLDKIQAVLNVNVAGAFQVIQVFARAMLAQGRGSIINIGSLYASVSPDARFYDHIPCDPPFLKPPAYGASKAGLVNLTKYLATHWGAKGVRVNTLSPGGVLGEQDEQFKTKFCARVPMGRMAVDSDLSGPLLFLASEASSYVTGTELRVDGGYTAW